ncbi:OmpH family outer membrane protein [Opitutus sp. GAS368]|jgi:Skp family chaperone for outer membrane proteins|uniref:OmpH family outer membrane protein n=1 Tax=Opitutus sp. GAS368 TaxID=1882749 RepID=UPI00087D06BF|nr:OmpH family outer membrane protein [Opitutus sp. GAS368]SDR96189.1 chaperone for outer membrane proteins, Skp family [Opitutus sp. GAS368]
MKFVRLLSLPLLATALLAPLSAQPVKTPVIKAVEPSRVAFVNSGAFSEPATGIKQLVKVLQGLELEFSSQQSELSLLQEKLRTVAGELAKLRAEATPNTKAIEEKQTAGLALQQELQQKSQAAQQAYGQRQQEAQGPVSAEIGKELHAFATARDITLLFDLAKLGDGLIDAKPEADLTADFIAYYNAKHP